MQTTSLTRQQTRILDIVETMPDDAPYIYLVVSNTELKFYAKQKITSLKGSSYAARVRIVDLYSMHLLHGVDPLLVYIDDAVFDSCTAQQMNYLHQILDARDNIFVEEEQ